MRLSVMFCATFISLMQFVFFVMYLEILEPQPLPPPPATSSIAYFRGRWTSWNKTYSISTNRSCCGHRRGLFLYLEIDLIAMIDCTTCTTSHFFRLSLHSFVNVAHQSLEGDLFQHMCRRCNHAQTSPFQFPDELVSMSKLLRESTSEQSDCDHF